MKIMAVRLLSVLLPAAFSGTAAAAAFQLLEQNGSGQGVAYAGSAAVAENASTIFPNPAGMTQLKGIQVSAGAVAIGTSIKFRNDGSSTTVLPLNGGNGGDAGGWTPVPNAYVSWQLSPQWYVGLGFSVPFGLGTKYDSDWVGRYHSVEAGFVATNINPSVAYKVNDVLSLGFGVNFQHIDAKMSHVVGLDTLTELKGEDHSWGWNIGALITPSPNTRIGLSYRSAITHKIKGDLDTQGFPSTPISAEIKLPDTFILSAWQQLSDRWEGMGDLSYTHWSTLDDFETVNRSTGQVIGGERFGYKDSWRVAFGAAYKVNDAWKVKFGLGYERTPTTDEDRSPRVPDENTLRLSLGGQWKPCKDTTVDLGYSYLHVMNPQIGNTKQIAFVPGGSSTLNGDYKVHANFVGVQVSHSF